MIIRATTKNTKRRDTLQPVSFMYPLIFEIKAIRSHNKFTPGIAWHAYSLNWSLFYQQGPLFLTWFNFNPSMDK